MADQEHSTLTGSALHENKGVSTAVDDTVATATGGQTFWKKLTSANLDATFTPFAQQVMIVQETYANNTSGATSPAAAYAKRLLNTTILNEISGASLASNQITLPAGTYWVETKACTGTRTSSVGATRTRFRNVTDSTTPILGLSTQAGTAVSLPCQADGRFTIAGAKTFELQHFGTAAVAEGFGAPCNSGDLEVYAQVLIIKLA